MYVASKYEDVRPLRLSELVYITENTYTEKEVLVMEKKMLETLNFDLVVPSPYSFLNRFCIVSSANKVLFRMAHYLLELSLLEVEMLKYAPSL
jgi:G2/mitotic-specific cyclin-B, other